MWTRLRLWVMSLVRRTRFEDELANEVAFHLQARADEWARQGVAPAEALPWGLAPPVFAALSCLYLFCRLCHPYRCPW